MRWGRSIKTRLILWNALVVMLIYGIAATLIYIFVRTRLESLVMEKLDESLNVVCTVVYQSGGDFYDWYHLGHDIPFLIMQDGQHAYHTTAWTRLDLPLHMQREDFKNDLKDHILDEGHYTLKSRKVQTGIEEMHNFLVVLAMEDSETRESIDGLAAKLSSGAYFILLLALAGGTFLANRALKPMKLITQKARQISAQSLSERLPVVHPKDEIGQLTIVINNMLDRLEGSFDRLKRFTSDASHEFRTPLTSIRSIGEVALKHNLNRQKYREAIGSMLEETERLTQLVNNLLILTRGDAGKVKLVFAQEDLISLINDVIEELRILAEDKNINLSFTHSDDIVLNIHKATLQHAVTNVLHNAIKYTPKSGRVKVTVSQTKDNCARVDISDNGPGVPADVRDKVFERFFRIDDARSRTNGGAGLGLSIAKWAVELNGGTIEFVDNPEGSRCRIILNNSKRGNKHE
ncbi:HAMP domain-containing protein [candidate division KSB1 bacterium]|nr:HAMP domain-containing protein [candidate division KSB1 bacterium]RQW04390.1 MAG: HAMP domain-containing protein [candidate division KSB1 bacterium]